MGLRDIGASLPPGFRFYPSDEELVCHYLYKKIANGGEVSKDTLVEIDLHTCEPWQLPGMFCPSLPIYLLKRRASTDELNYYIKENDKLFISFSYNFLRNLIRSYVLGDLFMFYYVYTNISIKKAEYMNLLFFSAELYEFIIIIIIHIIYGDVIVVLHLIIKMERGKG